MILESSRRPVAVWESNLTKDPYAGVVTQKSAIVGHVPWHVAAAFTLFTNAGNSSLHARCTVLPADLCLLVFKSSPHMLVHLLCLQRVSHFSTGHPTANTTAGPLQLQHIPIDRVYISALLCIACILARYKQSFTVGKFSANCQSTKFNTQPIFPTIQCILATKATLDFYIRVCAWTHHTQKEGEACITCCGNPAHQRNSIQKYCTGDLHWTIYTVGAFMLHWHLCMYVRTNVVPCSGFRILTSFLASQWVGDLMWTWLIKEGGAFLVKLWGGCIVYRFLVLWKMNKRDI